MPNWCSNSIIIKDLTIEQVADLERYIAENDGRFFQYFRPRPKKDDDDWYDWNLKNWGTKWDACDTHISETHKDKIVIMFESAWAPPTELYYYIHDKGYKFVAKYSEPMMGFAGIFEDGMDMYWETFMDWETLESIANKEEN